MGTVSNERIFRIKRNLSDAGCDAAVIARFLELEEQHRRKEQYQLLSGHRSGLLEQLHQNQYKIDCLDYMVFAMRREDGK